MTLICRFLSTPSDAVFCIVTNFYPRPPRGGRLSLRWNIDTLIIFLSTPSARRATQKYAALCNAPVISIHALREEGDPLNVLPEFKADAVFLSTPSARRATDLVRQLGAVPPISIHALREEGDC